MLWTACTRAIYLEAARASVLSVEESRLVIMRPSTRQSASRLQARARAGDAAQVARPVHRIRRRLYDNALAEAVNGLYKTELIRQRGRDRLLGCPHNTRAGHREPRKP